MTTVEDTAQRITRRATMQWIRVSEMDVSPVAQRDLQPAHVNKLAAKFDVNKLGYLVVNRRDGKVFVIDGNHRKHALEAVGMGDRVIECETYEGLTEQEEADLFLHLNATLVVGAFPRFKIAVTAGRVLECAVNDVVIGCGMKVALDHSDGSVSCVKTLTDIYQQGGEESLARTLIIIREAYGWAGLEAIVIGGIGLMVHRYGAQLNDSRAISGLSAAPGGARGLLGKAQTLRLQTGSSKKHCVAAAAVETINAQPGRKLANWWRAGAGSRRTRETPQAALADAV